MKQLYLKGIIVGILSLIGIKAEANAGKVDGIYYDLDYTTKTASVRSGSNKYSGAVTIPSTIIYDGTRYQVTSIGRYAFDGCTGLTSVTIPSSVTSIGYDAFYGCSGLTTITIPNSVTSIGMEAFKGCSGLTSVTIPNSVTSIGSSVFSRCSSLTSIIVASGNTVYDSRNNCNAIIEKASNTLISGCKTTMIPSSVTSIKISAFEGCSGLTSINIPSSVTSIEGNAFYGCTGLTSVVIPSSVTSIGYYAFDGCNGLTKVTINSNSIVSSDRTSSTSLSVVFGNQVKSYVIPSSVTSIGSNVFYGCSALTSIEIPSSVTNIGRDAFSGCTGLMKVIVKDISAWCNNYFSNDYSNPLYFAHHLYSDENTEITKLIIPNSVTNIGYRAFQGCSGLTSVTIPNSVTSIKNSAFKSCSGLTSVNIGNSVTSIGDNVFSGCTAKLYVNKGTKSLLSLWKSGYSAYETGTGNSLPVSSISSVSATQTSITVTITNFYDDFTYTINDEIVKKGENKTYRNMRPGKSKTLTLRVTLDDFSYSKDLSFSSKGIDLRINTSKTSSSISVVGSYTHGDAVVTKEEIYVDGKKVSDDNTGFICGLDPNTEHTIKYSTNFESVSEKVRTASLTLATSQPKVISAGNVIVAAESNLDDEETNVGFEWRRTDWTSEFPSNTGTAYLYNGTMEGYIRSLYTEKLWKYRPYYTSNAGNTYYGEWMGIDPTNTSYFEPTVHTYANVSVNGNSAEVKGYVQRGTDNVVSKGFAYWEQSQGVKSREAMSAPSMISSLPSNAKTVEVSGSQQVMTASLSNLEYETTYCYVAFVSTSEGDTFYGDVRSFATGADLTGIENVKVSSHEPSIEVARYNINGHRISSPQRGINIIRMSDGTTRKVLVK